MVVLIVDDQINVVNGMVSGIDWGKISVSKVLKAYNARDARTEIINSHVDIVLCDIEMPGENGLSLFEWIRGHNENIECIFLTAHADFAYAREVVALGGFDYILQPAKYEDIEKAIVRAGKKIAAKTETEYYSKYGKLLYTKKEQLVNDVLKNWLIDKTTLQREAMQDLNRLHINLDESTGAYSVVLNVIKPENCEYRDLNYNLLGYGFQNILSELFRPYGVCVLISRYESEGYLLLILSGDKPLEDEAAVNGLEYFLNVCREGLSCDLACYLAERTQISGIQHSVDKLLDVSRDDVIKFVRVVKIKDYFKSSASQTHLISFKGWQQALTGGNTELVKKQAYAYLTDEKLTLKLLKQFYSEYMHVLAAACEDVGTTAFELFKDRDALEQSLTAYETVGEMKKLIEYSVSFFQEKTRKTEDDYIELVVQYIHRNIETDIRRGELAQTVHLNEDYLSRLFKKQMGVSLKEFIIGEKMKVAQNLIQNTVFPIGTIAVKVGFTNFSHFSQIYKKVMGVTPAEERL